MFSFVSAPSDSLDTFSHASFNPNTNRSILSNNVSFPFTADAPPLRAQFDSFGDYGSPATDPYAFSLKNTFADSFRLTSFLNRNDSHCIMGTSPNTGSVSSMVPVHIGDLPLFKSMRQGDSVDHTALNSFSAIKEDDSYTTEASGHGQ
ncbi:hypothetical protein AGDE_15653 [Angomonas deanei]|uniref:Uncharacterized protein n=1 Tax=Angomonas deanei TaxID=59799 RepID=A0A7G2CLY6_9TRYP|nr:hypothetical protein AGDE_15653 [Angomonas deanei]CAD2219563.1 hypothetical protein, conserved [Angomonas deanei]|eukprot:EPY18742.1 hypothetical protein AGDE_15653 [Angomonas deanei]